MQVLRDNRIKDQASLNNEANKLLDYLLDQSNVYRLHELEAVLKPLATVIKVIL
jgi:hypothetical protein